MPPREPSVRYRAIPPWMGSDRQRAIVAVLVEARNAAGMTQRDLAAKLGRHPSFVGKIEAVERNLSVLEFLEWAEAVGANGPELLRGL